MAKDMYKKKNCFHLVTNWLRNFSRQVVRLHLISYPHKELLNSLVLASDWLSNISVLFGMTKRDSEKEVTR